MGLISNLLKLFGFLSSFIGTLLFSVGFYFFSGPLFAYSLFIGLAIVTILVFVINIGFKKLLVPSSFAKRRGMTKDQKLFLSKSLRKKLLSGHIMRAFLIGFVVTYYNQVLMVFVTIFCALVILSTMKSRNVTLLKIILSAILGSIAGIAGVILSNFWF